MKKLRSATRLVRRYAFAITAAFVAVYVLADLAVGDSNGSRNWIPTMSGAIWLAVGILLAISRFAPPKGDGWFNVAVNRAWDRPPDELRWARRVRVLSALFVLAVIMSFGLGVLRATTRDLGALRVVQGMAMLTILASLVLLVHMDNVRSRS